MIPEHDHDRDDNLRPDPFIEVSWSGRIKKKKRQRELPKMYQPQVENPVGQTPAAQPMPPRGPQYSGGAAQQVPRAPQAGPHVPPGAPPRPPTGRPTPQRPRPPQNLPQRPRKGGAARFFVTITALGIFFFVLRGPGFFNFLRAERPSFPTYPSPTAPQFDYDPAAVTLEPGDTADNDKFLATVTNFTTDYEEFYTLYPEFAETDEYLVFELEVENTREIPSIFFYSMGWSTGETPDYSQQTRSCQLKPLSEDDDVDIFDTTVIDEGETLSAHQCVLLPDDFDPEEPGYIYVTGLLEDFRWKIPADVFN